MPPPYTISYLEKEKCPVKKRRSTFITRMLMKEYPKLIMAEVHQKMAIEEKLYKESFRLGKVENKS